MPLLETSMKNTPSAGRKLPTTAGTFPLFQLLLDDFVISIRVIKLVALSVSQMLKWVHKLPRSDRMAQWCLEQLGPAVVHDGDLVPHGLQVVHVHVSHSKARPRLRTEVA